MCADTLLLGSMAFSGRDLLTERKKLQKVGQYHVRWAKQEVKNNLQMSIPFRAHTTTGHTPR